MGRAGGVLVGLTLPKGGLGVVVGCASLSTLGTLGKCERSRCGCQGTKTPALGVHYGSAPDPRASHARVRAIHQPAGTCALPRARPRPSAFSRRAGERLAAPSTSLGCEGQRTAYGWSPWLRISDSG